MRRREFITLLGSAAAATWPRTAVAQADGLPVVGYLYFGVPELSASLVAAFRRGLSEAGFVEGRNVTVEYRFAHYDAARLPELAAELVHRRPGVIATQCGAQAGLAVKAMSKPVTVVVRAGVVRVQHR